jgi:hypothetical protein
MLLTPCTAMLTARRLDRRSIYPARPPPGNDPTIVSLNQDRSDIDGDETTRMTAAKTRRS